MLSAMALALLYHTATPFPGSSIPACCSRDVYCWKLGVTSAGVGAHMNWLVQETHPPVGLLRKRLPHTQVIQTPLPDHCSTTCPTKPKHKRHGKNVTDCHKSKRIVKSFTMASALWVWEVISLLLGRCGCAGDGDFLPVTLLSQATQPHQAVIMEGWDFAALSGKPPSDLFSVSSLFSMLGAWH